MTYVTDMSSEQLRHHVAMLQKMDGWNDPLSQRLMDEIAKQDEKIKVLTVAISEADQYLDTNSFTNIGHGSVLHTMFKDALGV